MREIVQVPDSCVALHSQSHFGDGVPAMGTSELDRDPYSFVS